MKAIKQWKGCKDVSESHLILSRVGIFCIDDEHNCHHSDRNICSRHRDNLGTRFKPKETCQHPQHQGLKQKVDRTMSMTMAEELFHGWGVLTPVGSGNNVNTLGTFTMK
jgi:hypothetical protein